VRQAVPVPWVFLNYHSPGLLFADFGDAKTLVRWTSNHIGLLLSLRCWITCQYPALDSFYSGGGVVSHLEGFLLDSSPSLSNVATLSLRWIDLLPFRYFCFFRAYKASLALYARIKQKYQNGNIHRKLRVATSTILCRPEVQYVYWIAPVWEVQPWVQA
jgi:hypothetical protein